MSNRNAPASQWRETDSASVAPTVQAAYLRDAPAGPFAGAVVFSGAAPADYQLVQATSGPFSGAWHMTETPGLEDQAQPVVHADRIRLMGG
jgi:hypothetical protein